MRASFSEISISLARSLETSQITWSTNQLLILMPPEAAAAMSSTEVVPSVKRRTSALAAAASSLVRKAVQVPGSLPISDRVAGPTMPSSSASHILFRMFVCRCLFSSRGVTVVPSSLV